MEYAISKGSLSYVLKQKTVLLGNNVAVRERAYEPEVERKRSFPFNSGLSNRHRNLILLYASSPKNSSVKLSFFFFKILYIQRGKEQPLRKHGMLNRSKRSTLFHFLRVHLHHYLIKNRQLLKELQVQLQVLKDFICLSN